MPKKQRARWVSPDRGILRGYMNNLIITTRQSPVRLLVDYLPQPSCGHYLRCSYSYSPWIADGLLLAKRGQKPTSVLFFVAVANAVVLIVWALYNKLRFKNSSIMQPTNIRRKNMQRAYNT